MENSELFIDQKELTYFLYDGQPSYEKFLATKSLKNKYEVLKFRPEAYANEPDQHLIDEANTVLELIKLHKSKEVDLNQHLANLSDLTPYSRSIEVHFNLFKNLALAFASSKNAQIIKALVDKVDILGSVLLQEIDFRHNKIEDNVETVASFHPETGKILINTPPGRAKLCKFYTANSTHVLVFARIKLPQSGGLSSPYPFFVELRNAKTLELNPGIVTKWMGPSYGGVSGREYAFEFKDYVVEAGKILLDKYLSLNDGKLEIKGDDLVIEYTTRLCLLVEQEQRISKSIREGLKAAFLTVRHSNNRTQFQTLDEKGKERPIFEYKFNKTRIMKGLIELLNLQITCLNLKRGVYGSVMTPQKSYQRLQDFFVFYDMFEAYVNEKCLLIIEAFRESLGGIGFLKYSGIPTLQENAIKNAVYTGSLKELYYLRFAKFFADVDLKNPGDFINFYAGWLTEGKELDNITQEKDYEQKLSFFIHFLAKKLLFYRSKVRETLDTSKDCTEVLKTMNNFENVTKLCETFILYLKNFGVFSKVGLNLNRSNQRLILTCLGTEVTANMIEDLPFYLSQEDKLWPKGNLETLNQRISSYIDLLGTKSIEIVESLGFDENLLNSCLCKTADQTYETMLNMAKNNNPRNNPESLDYIRKDLIEFLNRPANPKL